MSKTTNNKKEKLKSLKKAEKKMKNKKNSTAKKVAKKKKKLKKHFSFASYLDLANANLFTTFQGPLDLGRGLPGGSDSKESAYNVGDLGLIPGWGRAPGELNGCPLASILAW